MYCRSCGKEADPGEMFCGYCGQRLDSEPPPPIAPPPARTDPPAVEASLAGTSPAVAPVTPVLAAPPVDWPQPAPIPLPASTSVHTPGSPARDDQLARWLDGGLAAYARQDYTEARRLFAAVLAEQPTYERNGLRAAELLRQASLAQAQVVQPVWPAAFFLGFAWLLILSGLVIVFTAIDELYFNGYFDSFTADAFLSLSVLAGLALFSGSIGLAIRLVEPAYSWKRVAATTLLPLPPLVTGLSLHNIRGIQGWKAFLTHTLALGLALAVLLGIVYFNIAAFHDLYRNVSSPMNDFVIGIPGYFAAGFVAGWVIAAQVQRAQKRSTQILH